MGETQKKKNTMYLFTRDFRIADNYALSEALENTADNGICHTVFIFEPQQIFNNPYFSRPSFSFMCQALMNLSEEIALKGGIFEIILDNTYDPPKNTQEILLDLKRENEIDQVYLMEDYSPYARKRFDMIKQIWKNNTFEVKDTLLTGQKSGLKFTPYYKKAVRNHVHPIIKIPESQLKKIRHRRPYSHDVDILRPDDIKRIFRHTLVAIPSPWIYMQDRTNLREDALKKLRAINRNTKRTMMSAHLKFGTVSIREVAHYFKPFPELTRQLHWRDFYYKIIKNAPNLINTETEMRNKTVRNYPPWRFSEKKFQKWKTGRTGFPFVDAGMRELVTTGYMRNEARLACASFLIRDLNIDWRYGEKFFANYLMDYDMIQNNCNWRWVVGDYNFRPISQTMHPMRQLKKHDHKCEYVKKWISGLNKIPWRDILNWDKNHKKYTDEQIETFGYFRPMLDHDEAIKELQRHYTNYGGTNAPTIEELNEHEDDTNND